MNLTKGIDYVELTEDGEMLFVDGETQSTLKARYTYNPEDARLTIDTGTAGYETFLTMNDSGTLTACNYAGTYISAMESAFGNTEDNDPPPTLTIPLQALKELEEQNEGMFLGAIFKR